MGLSAALLCDFYKLSHRAMYPRGTQVVYSTWTPRGSRRPGSSEVVVFGHQVALGKLTKMFDQLFFKRDKGEVMEEYRRIVYGALGPGADTDTLHLEALHDLGYLPLLVRGLPEGMVTPLRVPHLTIQNTDPRFFWLTNYVETFLSCQLWQASTSATLAHEFRQLLEFWCKASGGDPDFVPFQGHDFSMRGMSSLESAMASGMGHLTSFVGTDTIPAIQALEDYYYADVDKGLVGCSVPATEHSVQCAYGDDVAYFNHVLDVHPEGIVSIVSDGYDFWDVLERVLLVHHDKIMARNGKVVIRPDSGDPVKIVCGDPDAHPDSLEYAGAIECLWDIFRGTTNAAGYKVLDPHIGLIYGDAITADRANRILDGLMSKGFASTNIVFGIGSFTYQYNTRDTFGWAMKATACVINGQEKAIFKTPKTDDGTKHSQRGRVTVQRDPDGKIYAKDSYSLRDNFDDDMLQEIYRDGQFVKTVTLAEIRERLGEARG